MCCLNDQRVLPELIQGLRILMVCYLIEGDVQTNQDLQLEFRPTRYLEVTTDSIALQALLALKAALSEQATEVCGFIPF